MRLFKRIIPVCLVLLACVGGPSPAAALRVGVILPLTGPQAEMGMVEKRSFELAVELLYPDRAEPDPAGTNPEPGEKSGQKSADKAGTKTGPKTGSDRAAKPAKTPAGKPGPPGGKTGPTDQSVSGSAGEAQSSPDSKSTKPDEIEEPALPREKIELFFADDASDPDQAVAAVNRLIDRDKVVVLTGGHSSRATAAACVEAQRRGVPFLVSTASADDLTRTDRENIFRLSPPSGTYFSGLIGFLTAVIKPETAIVILEDNPFGRAGLSKIYELAKKVGFRVAGAYPFRSGIGDFRDTLLARLPKSKVDLCFLVTGAVDGAIILNQAVDMGFQPGLYIGAAMGFADQIFRQNGREEADYLVTPVLWQQSLPFFGANAYHAIYSERFNQTPDYHGAEAFASVQILDQALKSARPPRPIGRDRGGDPTEKAAPTDQKPILDPVEKLTSADLRRALGEIEMMTVFGPVKFVNAEGWYRQNLPPTYLSQWLNGVLVPVWPEQIAVKDYVFPIPGWLNSGENKEADQTGPASGSTKD